MKVYSDRQPESSLASEAKGRGFDPRQRTSHRFDAIKFDYLVRFQVLTNSQKAVWPEKDQSSGKT